MRLPAVAASSVILLLPIVSLGQNVDRVTPPAQSASVTVTVEAKYPWVDSGVIVRKGERLSFRADGTIQWGTKPDQVAGPEGHGGKAGKLGAGGLIGRVGYNGKPFPIGRLPAPIVMTKSGKLFLGINDFVFGDNAGSFAVTILQSGAPSAER